MRAHVGPTRSTRKLELNRQIQNCFGHRLWVSEETGHQLHAGKQYSHHPCVVTCAVTRRHWLPAEPGNGLKLMLNVRHVANPPSAAQWTPSQCCQSFCPLTRHSSISTNLCTVFTMLPPAMSRPALLGRPSAVDLANHFFSPAGDRRLSKACALGRVRCA